MTGIHCHEKLLYFCHALKLFIMGVCRQIRKCIIFRQPFNHYCVHFLANSINSLRNASALNQLLFSQWQCKRVVPVFTGNYEQTEPGIYEYWAWSSRILVHKKSLLLFITNRTTDKTVLLVQPRGTVSLGIYWIHC